MTQDFQDNLLKFIVSTKEGRTYLPLLDQTCFDLPEKQVVFSLLSQYYDKYQAVPFGEVGRGNLLEFFSINSKKTQGMTDQAFNEISHSIRSIFDLNFVADTGILREEIVKFSQRKRIKNMFTSEGDKVKEGDQPFFDGLLHQMDDIVNLGKEADADKSKNSSGFLVRGHNPNQTITIVDGHPTFLRRLNRMTSSRGFKTPELIIFMGAPKSFKTGMAINLAANYMRLGLNVYVVDTENGAQNYKNRIHQCLLEATRDELRSRMYDPHLAYILHMIGLFGGELQIDYYPANTKTCADVEANLRELKEVHDWQPDVIIWDYPDLMRPEDRKINEKRLQIQAVYHDIIRLHNRWNCFGIGLSQVNKLGVNRETIDMTHFGEDFGKAMNAHAAFAICRTQEEQDAGLARVVPVMQREGVQYLGGKNQCYIEIDEARQCIKELPNPDDPSIWTNDGRRLQINDVNDQ